MSYFHYTNIDSFYHIVTSQKVWFSSLAFMNDEMEGFDLHQVLAEILGLKFGEERCVNTLKLIDQTIDTHLRFQMSFSASKLKDNISQWRAYTNLGTGVCIEFEEGFIDSRSKKIDCIYDFESKRRSIIQNQELKVNDVTIENRLNTRSGTEAFVKSVINTLVGFKNSSFKPEQEVRWIFSVNGANDSSIMYRPHRLGLTTYKEVPVDLTRIKSITIGPQVPEQNLKTIEDFVMVNECSGFVTKSKVTLR